MKLRGKILIGCMAVLLGVLLTASIGQARVYEQASEQPKPIRLEGVVTVVFEDGVNLGGYNNGFKQASFGLASLDNLLDQLEVTEAYRMWDEPLEKSNPDDAFYKASRIFELRFPSSIPVEEAIETLSQNPNIKLAEPVWAMPVRMVPNDPDFGDQWHHDQSADHDIDTPEAWNLEKGNRRMILAMIDSGTNYEHLDLAANIWINEGEDIDGDRVVFDPDDINGIDDDGNGKTDDLVGWDFFTGFGGSLTPHPDEDGSGADNDPMDWNGHGTHCAGIAAATTNNGRDVSGIAGGWNGTGRHEGGARIMCLRAGCTATDGIGYLNTNACGQAILYAVTHGADAINCSWGSSSTSTMNSGMQAARDSGVIVVHAAGNDNSQFGDWLDSDPYTEVISVAATTSGDLKAGFSNYGTWIDVSAPGDFILSTGSPEEVPTTSYSSGTSMSAPMVCGQALIIKSHKEGLSKSQIESLIYNTADDIDGLNPSFAGKLGSGRINVNAALQDLPYADFSTDVNQGNVPLTVNFTDLSPAAPNPPSFWDWHFGDGNTSNDENPSYVYDTPGLYDVSLYVSQNNAYGFGEEHRENYVWVQADTMIIGPIPEASGVQQVPVYLSNSIPVKDIQLSIQINGPAGADLGGSFLSTAGLRTDYFYDVDFNGFDPGNRQYGILLESSGPNESNYLEADTGAIIYLYVNVPAGAEGQVSIDTATASGKAPNLVTPWGNYFPVLNPSQCSHGDVDCDGTINVVDLTMLVAYLFSGGDPVDEVGGDVDGDGLINIVDVTYLVAYLFGGGPPPPA